MRLNSLSGRFLGLTLIFVLITEVLIFVPAMARFRISYLQTQLDLAQLGALALLATPDSPVSPDLERELLETANVLNVVLQRDDVRELVLSSPVPASVDRTFDLRTDNTGMLIRDALSVLAVREDRIIRVIGETRQGAEGVIEITQHQEPLRRAMLQYGRRILVTSLIVTLFVAALLFLTVRQFIVRPIQRVVRNMVAYRGDPEDATRIIEPAGGTREIREAEIALREMQQGLTLALRQKERLAALGGAVAKISHDLRSLLTTAQLLADRIEASSDPAVGRIAPKLVTSLSRAINLCERTLAFGKAEESPPAPARLALAPLVEEVLDSIRLAHPAVPATLTAEIPGGFTVFADGEQLHRILGNLVRNAAQALESKGTAAETEGRIIVRARTEASSVTIEVEDSGPGLPPKARENLFQPFRGGVRAGGNGLGLAIAAELVRGHGGTLALLESGARGTVFRILLPQEPARMPQRDPAATGPR